MKVYDVMRKARLTFLLNNAMELLLSIPKTVYFNFRVLPVKYAIKFPFVVSHHIKLKGVNKNSFICGITPLRTASMRIGFGASPVGIKSSKKGLICITNGGKIIVSTCLGISQGCLLIVDNCTLKIGNSFRSNYSMTVDCANSDVTIGNGVVLGWNVTIRNDDGHYMVKNGKQTEKHKPVVIGDNVWLCANSTVLKGTQIGQGSVLAYGSLLTKTVEKEHVCYAGFPAKVIHENVSWLE